MAIQFNSADCFTVDFNGTLLSGIAQDEDEPIRILPFNEEDEVTFGTGGCASINYKDDKNYFVEIDFSACSGTIDLLRTIKRERNANAYLAIDSECSDFNFFTTCAAILTNVSTTLGGNPGIKTVRFLAINPDFESATFQTF